MTAAPPTFPGSPPIDTRDRDDEHLRLLAIFYYIWGGLLALFSCCPSIYIVMGVVAIVNPEAMTDSNTGEPFPAPLAWMFVIMGVAFLVIGYALAACSIYTGRCLTQKKHRTFCFVIAALSCLSVPLGTILGVFTIVVLARDSVAAKFARSTATA